MTNPEEAAIVRVAELDAQVREILESDSHDAGAVEAAAREAVNLGREGVAAVLSWWQAEDCICSEFARAAFTDHALAGGDVEELLGPLLEEPGETGDAARAMLASFAD